MSAVGIVVHHTNTQLQGQNAHPLNCGEGWAGCAQSEVSPQKLAIARETCLA